MATHVLTGTRIRDRRLQIGLKQAELARAAEISPSYLNLIEHNRRRIGGGVLVKIASVLKTDPTTLSEGADAGLLDGLRTVAAEADSRDLEVDEIDAFVARFPGWASQINAQQERIKTLEKTLRGLDDRLTHDPVLSEKMHDVLGAVAAIRSTSSILVETPDIDADWRARFHANIDAESRKLAESSAAMAEHFDRLARDEEAYLTPLETLSQFFEQRRFHLAELEEANSSVEAVLDAIPELATQAVRELATKFLQVYRHDAARMPLADFISTAEAYALDPARLSTHYGVSLTAVFRRMASLPRAANLPEIGLVSCDAAGAILLRKQPAGFPLPRFGAACPLWPLFSALRNPGLPQRQLLTSSEGARYIAYAIAGPRAVTSFDEPQTVEAVMLLVADDHFRDRIDQLMVGPSCRLCSRASCSARREPSLLEQLEPMA